MALHGDLTGVEGGFGNFVDQHGRCATERILLGVDCLVVGIDRGFKDLGIDLHLLELGRGRGISNLDKKARITRLSPLI